MKLIFSNYDDVKNPYYRGGGAQAIFELAKHLAKKNKITILTGRYPGSKDEVINNVHYKRIGPGSFGPKLSQIIFQAILPWYASTEKYDIWIENLTPPFPFAFLPYFTKKPVIGLAQLLNAKEIGQKYKLPFFEVLEKIGLSAFKYIIALSDFQKEKIQKSNPKAKVTVIPNGVNFQKKLNIKKNRSGNQKYILFMGRIDVYHKGLDLLLSAFNLCKGQVNMNLIIAGDGPEESIKYLKELIKSYNLQKRVKLYGFAESSKKNELYQNCEFLLVPSRFEGFGLVILEALSFRKPVIVYDIKDLSWVSDDVAIKVKPFSIEKLSKSIIDFSTKDKLLNQKKVNIKNFLKSFAWSNISSEYSKLLKDISLKEKNK